MTEILSIGHSVLDADTFVATLRQVGVQAVADVRSSPFSRNVPQFNRDTLKQRLGTDGISYAFLGAELGGRPAGREFYTEGVADYEKMAKAPTFMSGLDRLEQGSCKYRIAMMCSEGNPLDCHRCLLVGRALAERGLAVRHMLPSGETLTQPQIEGRLLAIAGMDQDDMFASPTDRLNEAYRHRARRVAYAEDGARTASEIAAE